MDDDDDIIVPPPPEGGAIKTRHRKVGCGKACFTSEESARKAIRRAEDRGHHQGWKGRIHPYWCPECRAVHIGHRQRKPKGQAKR